MTQEELLERIIIDPNIMIGKPVIKGTRLTVQHVLGLQSQGITVEEILQEYEGLSKEDIRACYLFASKALEDSSFVPLCSGTY